MSLCDIKDCTKQRKGHGLCPAHLRRKRLGQDMAMPIRKAEQHGHTYHELYKTWANIKQRCTNQNIPDYQHYGARGIKMCDRWLDSFECFLNDMGERPQGTTIDRIDVNGDYTPKNCRWADLTVQGLNRTTPAKSDTGCMGVTFDKRLNKYRARVKVLKKEHYLGHFSDLKEAINIVTVFRQQVIAERLGGTK